MKNVVVNPEVDPASASEIEEIANSVENKFPMERDYCGQINTILRRALSENFIPSELVYGCYRVDSYKGWLDEYDFSDNELSTIKEIYGNTSRESLEKFVDELDDDSKKDYYFIPHVFLVCDNFIVDGASDMFNVSTMGKRNAKRYYTQDLEPII